VFGLVCFARLSRLVGWWKGWEKKGESEVSVPLKASVDRGGRREEKCRKE